MKRILGVLMGLLVCVFAISQVEADLVGYWKMDGTDAVGNVPDYSGYARDCNVYGGAYMSTQAFVSGDRSLYLDGIDDYITSGGTDFDFTNQLTVEAWIRPLGMTNKVYKRFIVDSYFIFGMRYEGLQMTIWGPNPYPSVQIYTTEGNKGIGSGSWFHVASTYDGATLKIYVNGDQSVVIDDTNPISSIGNGGSFRIGTDDENPSYGYLGMQGWIDEVKVYNHALTAEEINDSYLDGLISQTGIVECPPCPTIADAIEEVSAYADAACPPGNGYKNHGEYVSCVSHAVEVAIGSLTADCFSAEQLEEISSAVVSARARSQVGK